MTPPPIESIIAFALALCILVGCLIYDREGTLVRLRRIVTLGITRKPKKERLLSPWELAAIEIECGIEPSWTPPPVASLVTGPRDDASALNLPKYRYGGQVKPLRPVYPPRRPPGSKPPRVMYLPPGMEVNYLDLSPDEQVAFHIRMAERKERR